MIVVSKQIINIKDRKNVDFSVKLNNFLGQNEPKFSISFRNVVIRTRSHSTISLCISESNLDKRTVTDMGVPLIEGETPVMFSLTRDTQRDG
jgi:hypothetical protein